MALGRKTNSRFRVPNGEDSSALIVLGLLSVDLGGRDRNRSPSRRFVRAMVSLTRSQGGRSRAKWLTSLASIRRSTAGLSPITGRRGGIPMARARPWWSVRRRYSGTVLRNIRLSGKVDRGDPGRRSVLALSLMV